MILMHKDIPVAKIEMRGTAIAEFVLLNKEHMPTGLSERLIRAQFPKWLAARTIPQNRQGREKIQRVIGDIGEAAVKSMVVSLTDCYWLKPDGSNLVWRDVNFHDNGFSDQLSDVVTGDASNITVSDFRLPDLTTDGVLEKTWMHSGNTPVLLKRGNLPGTTNNLLSANEVIASAIGERLGISIVPYSTVYIREEALCGCPCFISDSNVEFVSAHYVCSEYRVYGPDLFTWFVQHGTEKEIKDLIFLDHLIHNTDRHEKNFGILRDPDSLQILGMAPIFDSGTSLDWNGMRNAYKHDAKPFFDNRYEQLALLTSEDIRKRNNIDPAECAAIIESVYEKYRISEGQKDLAVQSVKTSCQELVDRTKLNAVPEKSTKQ